MKGAESRPSNSHKPQKGISRPSWTQCRILPSISGIHSVPTQRFPENWVARGAAPLTSGGRTVQIRSPRGPERRGATPGAAPARQRSRAQRRGPPQTRSAGGPRDVATKPKPRPCSFRGGQRLKTQTRHRDEAAFTPTRKERVTKGTLTRDTVSQELVPPLKNRHGQSPEQADGGGRASPPETRAGHGLLAPAARRAVRQEEEREGVRLEPKKRNGPCLQMTYLST